MIYIILLYLFLFDLKNTIIFLKTLLLLIWLPILWIIHRIISTFRYLLWRLYFRKRIDFVLLDEQVNYFIHKNEKIIKKINFINNRIIITDENIYLQKYTFFSRKSEIKFLLKNAICGINNIQGSLLNWNSKFKILMFREDTKKYLYNRRKLEQTFNYPKYLNKEVEEFFKILKNEIITDEKINEL